MSVGSLTEKAHSPSLSFEHVVKKMLFFLSFPISHAREGRGRAEPCVVDHLSSFHMDGARTPPGHPQGDAPSRTLDIFFFLFPASQFLFCPATLPGSTTNPLDQKKNTENQKNKKKQGPTRQVASSRRQRRRQSHERPGRHVRHRGGCAPELDRSVQVVQERGGGQLHARVRQLGKGSSPSPSLQIFDFVLILFRASQGRRRLTLRYTHVVYTRGFMRSVSQSLVGRDVLETVSSRPSMRLKRGNMNRRPLRLGGLLPRRRRRRQGSREGV